METKVRHHGTTTVATEAIRSVQNINNCLSKKLNKVPPSMAPSRYPTALAENIVEMWLMSVLIFSARSSRVGPGSAMQRPCKWITET